MWSCNSFELCFVRVAIQTVPTCLYFLFISAPPKIQLSAKDFENEKIDRQSMQHQLHKVLKELRKARDQIAKLESAVSVRL